MKDLTIKWLSLVEVTDAVELFDNYREFYRCESDTSAALKFLTDRLRKINPRF
jgi:hypothetical protein